MTERGSFVVSLDTELAWGLFDTGKATDERVQEAYEATPGVIDSLLELFDEFEMPVTWAVVAHLLEVCGGHNNDPEPSYSWVDWFATLPCQTGLNSDYWYSPSVLRRIRNTTVEHEIGLHGYTHMILGADGCDGEAARVEIERGVEILESHGIHPKSYVFPRNSVGHVEQLSANGLHTYRGVDARWYERLPLPERIRGGLRFFEEASNKTPPVVTPKRNGDCIEIPGSQVFRPYHGGWQHTGRRSQRVRAKKGIDRAARKGEIFHLWFHPFNLGRQPARLLSEFESILKYAATLRRNGQLDIMTMAQVADAFESGRWQ